MKTTLLILIVAILLVGGVIAGGALSNSVKMDKEKIDKLKESTDGKPIAIEVSELSCDKVKCTYTIYQAGLIDPKMERTIEIENKTTSEMLEERDLYVKFLVEDIANSRLGKKGIKEERTNIGGAKVISFDSK